MISNTLMIFLIEHDDRREVGHRLGPPRPNINDWRDRQRDTDRR